MPMPPRASSPTISWPDTVIKAPGWVGEGGSGICSSGSESELQAQAGQRPGSRLFGNTSPQAGQRGAWLIRRYLRNAEAEVSAPLRDRYPCASTLVADGSFPYRSHAARKPCWQFPDEQGP